MMDLIDMISNKYPWVGSLKKALENNEQLQKMLFHAFQLSFTKAMITGGAQGFSVMNLNEENNFSIMKA